MAKGSVRIGAVAGHFGRDLPRGLAKVLSIVTRARGDGVDVLVLPCASLGGYLGDLHNPDTGDLPPGLTEQSPEIEEIVQAAGKTVVCFGFTEKSDGLLYNSALCVSGTGVLGRHRKVHRPPGEAQVYAGGESFAVFDTPAGRMGMLIDYDKTFPEASRSLALDGADIVACLSAWPASVTDRASRLPNDRQARLFDLYDCARAAENQVVWASANQTGVTGSLRFLGQAKVVGPGGEILARTGSKGGMAIATIDVGAELTRSRRTLHHLDEVRGTAGSRASCAGAAL